MTFQPDPTRGPYTPQVQHPWGGQPPIPPGPPAQPEPPQKPGRGRRVLTLALAGTAGLVLGVAASGANSGSETPSASPTVTRTVRAAGETPKSTVVVTSTTKPKKVFGDGAWMVGRDVPAGKYTTIEEVGGNCYWERHNPKSTGIDAIIANGNVTGGHPTVIVKTGEEFRSTGCGEWKAA